MRAEVQYGWIVVEDRLGAVAVVDIPVHHEDASEVVVLSRVPGPDGYIIEETEAHGPIGERVMARRTHRAEDGVQRPDRHAINGVRDGAHRTQRRIPRFGRSDRIVIQSRWPFTTRTFDRVDVGAGVDKCERLKRSRSRVEMDELAPESDRTQVIADGPEPLGPLRMIWSSLVLEETWMEGEADPTTGHKSKLLTFAFSLPRSGKQFPNLRRGIGGHHERLADKQRMDPESLHALDVLWALDPAFGHDEFARGNGRDELL